MSHTRTAVFSPNAFLTSLAGKQTVIRCQKQQVIFSEGDTGEAVFYIKAGWIALTVAHTRGKVVVAILKRGSLFGEACLGGQARRHTTATALEICSLVRIDKHAMLSALRSKPAYSELLLSYILSRNLRIEADLVDQRSNSSEKRLARVLLLLADFGSDGKPAPPIPKINQRTLADTIGTTRSRVSFFLNGFRKRGFIQYNGEIRVHRSLRTVVDAPLDAGLRGRVREGDHRDVGALTMKRRKR
jgi:CRP/FNR family cyclic AMP-dependent transcriptional regulator